MHLHSYTQNHTTAHAPKVKRTRIHTHIRYIHAHTHHHIIIRLAGVVWLRNVLEMLFGVCSVGNDAWLHARATIYRERGGNIEKKPVYEKVKSCFSLKRGACSGRLACV